MAYFSGILPMFWTPISYSCFCLYLPIIYPWIFLKKSTRSSRFKKPQRFFSPRQTTLEFWRTRVQLLDLLIASEYWCPSGPVADVERSGWRFFFGCREPWKHSPNWIMIYIYIYIWWIKHLEMKLIEWFMNPTLDSWLNLWVFCYKQKNNHEVYNHNQQK